MAPGVAKTFIKELYKVLSIRYPECSLDGELAFKSFLTNEGIKEELKKWRKQDKNGLILNRLDDIKDLLRNKYWKALNEQEVESLITLTMKYTDDATHQAMEALVHNLNSMHSRAGRTPTCPNCGKPQVL